MGFTLPIDEAQQLAFDGVNDPVDNQREFDRAAETIYEAWAKPGRAGQDTTVAAVTPDLGRWTGAAANKFGALTMGMDVEQISTVDFAAQPKEVGDRLVKEGFGTVVSSFGHGVPVRLGTAVAKVQHGPEGVEITAWGGKKWHGKTVLITASTGVLAAEKIAFDPPLPQWKKEAIDALPQATFNKVALQFSRNVFGNAEVGAHVRDLQTTKDGMEFVVRPGGDNVAVALVGGEYSRTLNDKGQQAAIELTLSRLEKMFGPAVRKHFVKGTTTNWDAEPWAMGSFSCTKPGYADARKIYEKPVGSTLYFAGEAGDEAWAGCVPGAYLSANRAAQRITEHLAEARELIAKRSEQVA